MSFAALLTQRAVVQMRAPGQERWVRMTHEPIACRVVALSPREVEMSLAHMRAEVTHLGRCLPHTEVRAGRRLVLSTGEAYLIVAVRRIHHPAPHGHLSLSLQAM